MSNYTVVLREYVKRIFLTYDTYEDWHAIVNLLRNPNNLSEPSKEFCLSDGSGKIYHILLDSWEESYSEIVSTEFYDRFRRDLGCRYVYCFDTLLPWSSKDIINPMTANSSDSITANDIVYYVVNEKYDVLREHNLLVKVDESELVSSINTRWDVFLIPKMCTYIDEPIKILSDTIDSINNIWYTRNSFLRYVLEGNEIKVYLYLKKER